MLIIRTIAVAASLAGVFGAPAFAQGMVAPAAAPATAQTPLPDVGMKAVPPAVKTHPVSHRHVRHKTATVAPTKA